MKKAEEIFRLFSKTGFLLQLVDLEVLFHHSHFLLHRHRGCYKNGIVLLANVYSSLLLKHFCSTQKNMIFGLNTTCCM